MTDNKLYLSTDKGLSWKEIYKTQHAIIDVSTVDNQISILVDESVNISNDYGLTWNQLHVPEKCNLISTLSDKTVVVANKRDVFRLNNNNWEKTLSPRISEIIDLIILNDILIVYDAEHIGIDPDSIVLTH